ncbi:hypothetical protein IU457_29450, partial [Nocardia cyriacigeorgica]|nr:hypothetical protein [Nocardia cyriacigeorgica]
TKGRDLDIGTRCRNTLLSAMRAPAERANALLKTRWKALQRISEVFSPESHRRQQRHPNGVA